MKNAALFPLGDIQNITPTPSVVACTECHGVYQGDKPLGPIDRYTSKEPVAGWIRCVECRRAT